MIKKRLLQIKFCKNAIIQLTLHLIQKFTLQKILKSENLALQIFQFVFVSCMKGFWSQQVGVLVASTFDRLLIALFSFASHFQNVFSKLYFPIFFQSVFLKVIDS